MKSIFPAGTAFEIVAPGEMYVVSDCSDRGYDAGPIEFMYVISSNEQVGPAVELEFSYLDDYTLKEYLGFEKIADGCFCFKVLFYNPIAEKDVVYERYLHRLQSLDKFIAARDAELARTQLSDVK